MGAIDFPSNPTDQQVFSSGGVNYIYNASIGAWLTSYVSTPLYTSANTQVLYNDDGQSKGNTGLVFDRRANTLIVNNLVAAGSNVASVINSAFGKANTSLQNTSGTFAGSLSVTANVGIGVSSPAYRIHVVKSDPSSLGPIARLYHGPNSDRSMEFGTTSGGNFLSYIQARASGDSSYDLALNPDGGNVGIGNTKPSATLHVKYSSDTVENYPTGTWASKIIMAADASNYNGLLVANRWAADDSTAFQVGSLYGSGSGGNFASYYKITGLGTHIFGGSATGVERMRIDSSGRVTMPYQPMVQAYKTNGGWDNLNGYYIYNTAAVNVGNHYNTSTGLFTCPIAGKYKVYASILLGYGAGASYFSLYVNGAAYSSGGGAYVNMYSTSVHVTTSQSWIVNCAAGDTLGIDARSTSTAVYGPGWNNLTIELIG